MIKDTIEGIICIIFILLIVLIFRLMSELREEDSKRGEIVKKLFQICWGTFLVYLTICGILIPLIILIVKLCS